MVTISTPNKYEFRNVVNRLNYDLLVKVAENQQAGSSASISWLKPNCKTNRTETENRKRKLVQLLLNYAQAGAQIRDIPITDCEINADCLCDESSNTNWTDLV